MERDESEHVNLGSLARSCGSSFLEERAGLPEVLNLEVDQDSSGPCQFLSFRTSYSQSVRRPRLYAQAKKTI